MRNPQKVLKGNHPRHGKSNGQRLLPPIKVTTKAEPIPHPVISTGQDYPCGNFIARCQGRTLRPGGRCPECSGRKLPAYRPASKDGTPKGVLSTGRIDTKELREVRSQEVSGLKVGLKASQRARQDMLKRARAERERQAAKRLSA